MGSRQELPSLCVHPLRVVVMPCVITVYHDVAAGLYLGLSSAAVFMGAREYFFKPAMPEGPIAPPSTAKFTEMLWHAGTVCAFLRVCGIAVCGFEFPGERAFEKVCGSNWRRVSPHAVAVFLIFSSCSHGTLS